MKVAVAVVNIKKNLFSSFAFLFSGSFIWNAHTKFQPNPLRNEDFDKKLICIFKCVYLMGQSRRTETPRDSKSCIKLAGCVDSRLAVVPWTASLRYRRGSRSPNRPKWKLNFLRRTKKKPYRKALPFWLFSGLGLIMMIFVGYLTKLLVAYQYLQSEFTLFQVSPVLIRRIYLRKNIVYWLIGASICPITDD